MTKFTIHSPLLVFDKVHRRTGTIERTCLFTNQKPEELELEVQYDFLEHSWVQIYGSSFKEGRPSNGGGLLLHPGENQILLSLNTDNFNFPDGRFKGRIAFQDKEDDSTREWIEINFEEVQDLEPFRGYAAVDLGTSSSTLALYHIQRDAVSRVPWSPRLHRAETDIPSAVYIRNFQKFSRHCEGSCLVGEDAFQAYRTAEPKDPHCLQLGIKRLVGSPRVLATDEKGTGGFVDPLEVLYVLAKSVRERCQQNPQVQALLQKIIVTYPPTWNHRQLTRFKEVFRRLGWKDEDLDFSLDEASAAGLFYIYKCLKDRDSFHNLIQDLLETEVDLNENGKRGKGYTLRLLSFDFGGGSIDLALLEARLELLPKTIRLRLSLLGSDSCEFGGDQVTLAVFRILKRRLAMALCDPQRIYEEMGQGAGNRKPPETSISTWLPPVGLRRNPPASFLLPDGSPTSRSAFMGWGEEAERPDPRREVLLQNWGYLSTHISEPVLEKELEDAVEAFFPTRFLPSEKDLFAVQARLSFDWLWRESESLKRRLFAAVHREHHKEFFPSFECLKKFRLGLALHGAPDRKLEEAIPWAASPAAEKVISVGADEVFQAIAQPLEAAVARARKLCEGGRVDRIALSGRSSRIPMVRWLLARPPSEGGLGIPPVKIEFDEENAKSAVSKGACLLQVMRETLVGFEVDVADFKANLLSDLFYLQVDGSRRLLFKAGFIDDLSFVEEVPETRSFPKYLSIFYGSEQNLIGQFLFKEGGEELPPAPKLKLEGTNGGLPPHRELLLLREKDRARYNRSVAALLGRPDRERIAWMEQGATPGSQDEPIYRYYLTRNHALYALRDSGNGAKRLYEIQPGESARRAPSPEENPFSGIH